MISFSIKVSVSDIMFTKILNRPNKLYLAFFRDKQRLVSQKEYFVRKL